MDAMWERMESVWTLHDLFMVETWMPCGNGCSLCGHYMTLSWLGQGCSVRTNGVCVDVSMVETWMLCGNGWSLCGCRHG